MKDIERSQLNIVNNVTFKKRSLATNKILQEVRSKNMVTRLSLASIAKIFYSELEGIEKYCPSYFAIGNTGTPNHSPTVTTSVTVNDTMLYGELPTAYERIKIASRSIDNNVANDYVRVNLQAYILSESFNEVVINEAGIFTGTTGNNCLARVVMDPAITKDEGTVIDILWTITITSMTEA